MYDGKYGYAEALLVDATEAVESGVIVSVVPGLSVVIVTVTELGVTEVVFAAMCFPT